MTGREFIDKVNNIQYYVKELNNSITTSDSSEDVIKYGIDEQKFIRDCLNDYRWILLEREL